MLGALCSYFLFWEVFTMDFKEKQLSSKLIYDGKVVKLYVDDVKCSNNNISKREIVKHNGGVCVLAIVDDKVILEKQYRYAYDEVLFKTVKKATPFVRYNIKELQNYSRMDLEHLLMMFDSYVDGKVKYDSTQLLQNSIIDSDLDIAFYSRLDEYSLTHSIFYVTDFGNNNIPVAVYKRIVYILQTMAYKNYFMNDLDLLGEYIMCLCFMHCGNGCLKELYAGLVSCQNRDGSFSGPSRDGLRKNSKGLKGLYKRQKKIVLDNYHTTLVAIMAMVLYKED